MAEPIITCPKCKTEIKLTEALVAPQILSEKFLMGSRAQMYKYEFGCVRDNKWRLQIWMCETYAPLFERIPV